MSAATKPQRSAPPSPREGFALLLALIVFVPGAKAVLYDTLDPDAFIHLRAANLMAQQGVGPIVDDSSYMSRPEPWTPYSWLAEFAMKFVWDAGGYRAALISHGLMAAGLLLLVAMACATRLRPSGTRGDAVDESSGRVNVLIATAFATFLSIPYLSFRPVTLGLVVMAACLWLIVRDRAAGERTRAAWLLIPLTVLLINIHLYAILIPAWCFALLAGAAWEMWRTPGGSGGDARREARGRLGRYALLTVGTLLACLATPMLPGAVRSIVFYQFGDAMVAGPVVKEYQPFYKGTMGTVAAVLVVLMLAAMIVRRRQLRAGEVFWLLGSMVLLMRMGRFTPVFAMVAAPMFAATIVPLADRVLTRAVVRLAVMVVLGLGLYRVIMSFPGPGVSLDAWLNRNGPLMPGYPAGAAAFVEENVTPRTGRIINEYDWGGYLAWRLGPRFKVLLDGRTNVYEPEFWRKTYLSSHEELSEFLGTIDADAAIVPTEGRFHLALAARGWVAATGPGSRAVVLLPPGSQVAQPD